MQNIVAADQLGLRHLLLNPEIFDFADYAFVCLEDIRDHVPSRLPGTKHIIHLLRGQVYEMGKFGRWFCMGGAPSHDIGGRIEGESWWPREMPSQEEYDEALVRKLLERVMVYDDHLTFEFKSGIEIGITM